MIEKKYIYFGSKIFSIYDRYSTYLVYKSIEDFITKYSLEINLFLPFKDSNNSIINTNDLAYDIFLKDIEYLDKTSLFIGRLDSLHSDSGVGFELGYLYGKKVPSILLKTDFLETNYIGQSWEFSNICDKICYIIKYDDKLLSNDYGMDLKYKIESLNTELINLVDQFLKGKIQAELSHSNDNTFYKGILIDINGNKFDWCKKISNVIYAKLNKEGLISIINDRYNEQTDEIDNCRNTDILITTIDCDELDLDSSFLIGYAYSQNKKIFILSTRKTIYVSKKGQKMILNLMLEKGAVIVHSIEELISKIKEEKNCDLE